MTNTLLSLLGVSLVAIVRSSTTSEEIAAIEGRLAHLKEIAALEDRLAALKSEVATDDTKAEVTVEAKKPKHEVKDITYAKSLSPKDVQVTFTSCGTSEHAVQVRSVEYDKERNLVTAFGQLTKAVTGGTVTGRIKVGKDPSMGRMNRLKTKMALMWSGKSKYHEDFCEHISRGKARYEGIAQEAEAHCPLSPGEQKFHFTMQKIPGKVMAGEYNVKVNAAETDGTPLVCLDGKVIVPKGDNGESMRRLEACYCRNKMNHDDMYETHDGNCDWERYDIECHEMASSSVGVGANLGLIGALLALMLSLK